MVLMSLQNPNFTTTKNVHIRPWPLNTRAWTHNLKPQKKKKKKGRKKSTHVDFELGLNFPQLPSRQDLDVTRHLLPRSCLPRPEFDVPCYQLVPTCVVRQKKTKYISHQTSHEISHLIRGTATGHKLQFTWLLQTSGHSKASHKTTFS
jgi:hypothetical protein